MFAIVFLLLGNHESYHSSCADVKATIKDFAKETAEPKKNGEDVGKFVFLDQTRYDLLRRLPVLGCTLHSTHFRRET